jgi:hypothetical protein
VVEWTREQDWQRRLRRDHLLRQLADAVRACRPDRAVFIDGIGRRPIDQRGAWDHDPRIEREIERALEQMVRREHVAAEGADRILPRPVFIGESGAVINERGACRLERRGDRCAIQQVDRAPSNTRVGCPSRIDRPPARVGPRVHADVIAEQTLEQVTPREPCRARDQRNAGHVRNNGDP